MSTTPDPEKIPPVNHLRHSPMHYFFLVPQIPMSPCLVRGSDRATCSHLTHEANFTLYVVSPQICPQINGPFCGPYTPICLAF